MPCASQQKTVGKAFAKFPKFGGFIGEIIEAHEEGTLDSDTAAEWLLEAALGVPLREVHTKVRQGGQRVQNKKVTRDDDSRILYQWMVKVKGMVPLTARQYIYRLQALRAKGGLQDVEEAIRIAKEGEDIPNRSQLTAALALYQEFLKSQ